MNTNLPARRQTALFSPFEQWISNFFEGSGRFPWTGDGPVLPKADVAETDKEMIVTLEVPGVDENDIKVQVTADQLVVSGERKQRTEEKDKRFHRVETFYGAFERRFELPANVRKDADGVKATSHKGVLEIRIPKVEPRAAAKIAVKAV